MILHRLLKTISLAPVSSWQINQWFCLQLWLDFQDCFNIGVKICIVFTRWDECNELDVYVCFRMCIIKFLCEYVRCEIFFRNTVSRTTRNKICAMWCNDDFMFNKQRDPSLVYDIPLSTHWIRLRSFSSLWTSRITWRSYFSTSKFALRCVTQLSGSTGWKYKTRLYRIFSAGIGGTNFI